MVKFTSIDIDESGDYVQTNTCPVTLALGPELDYHGHLSTHCRWIPKQSCDAERQLPGEPYANQRASRYRRGRCHHPIARQPSFAQTPGTSISQSITLSNDGAAAVNVKSIAGSPSHGTFTQENNCPATLNPNTNCGIAVVFTAPDAGAYSVTLSVTDSGYSSLQTTPLSDVGADD